jgi:hypothetical protein
MSQVAFRYSVPAWSAADLVSNAVKAKRFAKELQHDLPFGTVSFLDATTSDTTLVVATTKDVRNPTNASGYLKRTSAAGGAAGSTAVTGAVASSVILAVLASNDTTHAVTDVTAEWVLVAHPPTAGHFDNTGGSDNTGSHVIFVFYNPPQTEAAVLVGG